MPVITIESSDDPRVAVYRDLPRTRDRMGDGRFIAEGRFLVERLWASELDVESIFCDESHLELAIAHCDETTPIFAASRLLLEETIGFNFHRGLLACGVSRETESLPTFLYRLGSSPATLVLLDQVVDQENMGGVIRNAAALGAHGVLIGPASARPFSRRVLRVSMGAIFNLPPMISQNLAADAELLRNAGFELVVTADSDEAIPLRECPPRERVAILFGNEGHGVAPHWEQTADICVRIPMALGVDSLNVASTSAIFIHHFAQT